MHRLVRCPWAPARRISIGSVRRSRWPINSSAGDALPPGAWRQRGSRNAGRVTRAVVELLRTYGIVFDVSKPNQPDAEGRFPYPPEFEFSPTRSESVARYLSCHWVNTRSKSDEASYVELVQLLSLRPPRLQCLVRVRRDVSSLSPLRPAIGRLGGYRRRRRPHTPERRDGRSAGNGVLPTDALCQRRDSKRGQLSTPSG